MSARPRPGRSMRLPRWQSPWMRANGTPAKSGAIRPIVSRAIRSKSSRRAGVHETVPQQLVDEHGRQPRRLADRTVGRGAGGTDRVAPPDERPEAEQGVAGFRLERAAAGLREHREEEARAAAVTRAVPGCVDLLEGAPVDAAQGRDHGDFRLGEVAQEPVLVEDGLPGPPAGPVELGDERLPVLPAHAVDAVDVARVRVERAVEHDAERALDGGHHVAGGERFERTRGHASSVDTIRASGAGRRLEGGEDAHRLPGASAAHADRRLQAGAHRGPSGQAEEGAPQVGGQLHAAHARRLAAGHAGDR